MHGYIKSKARYCLGLDHDENIVNELKQLGYNVIQGDAQNFSVDTKFDIICAFDVIEHLEDLKGFFESIKRALKDNGKLLLSTPNPWFFEKFIRCFAEGKGGSNPDHVHWFCFETMRELLGRYGFKIERMEFGSGQKRLYHYRFLPNAIRHTSIFIVSCKKLN